MSKMLATCAAIAVTALIALPAPAGAVEKSAPGVTKQTELTDVSAARRVYHRRYVRHHYRPYYGYRYRPYYGYRPGHYATYSAYAYYPQYRPYGPFGFGFGY